MKGFKYKIIGSILILGLIGLIAVIILVPMSDDGARQRAEDFLKAAIGAQNARIVYDAYAIQVALQNYYDINNQYPQTLAVIANNLSEFKDIDINNTETYTQEENGESYVITFSLKDARVFELGPDQDARELEAQARAIPDDFRFSEEQIESVRKVFETEAELSESELKKIRNNSWDSFCVEQRILSVKMDLNTYFEKHGLYPLTFFQLEEYIDSQFVSGKGTQSEQGLQQGCDGVRYAISPNSDNYHISFELQSCDSDYLKRDADFDSQILGWTNGFSGNDNNGSCPDSSRVFDLMDSSSFEFKNQHFLD